MVDNDKLIEDFVIAIKNKTNLPITIKKYDSGSYCLYFRDKANNNYHGDLLDHFKIFISHHQNIGYNLKEVIDKPEHFAKDYVNYNSNVRNYDSIFIEDFNNYQVREQLIRLIVSIKERFESYKISEIYQLTEKLKKKYSTYVGDDWRGRVDGFDGKIPFYRILAKKCIYDLNKKKYNLDFNKYEVHHRNGDKSDDDVRNLRLLTKEEHQKIHN